MQREELEAAAVDLDVQLVDRLVAREYVVDERVVARGAACVLICLSGAARQRRLAWSRAT